jgi:hypothetical protein
MVGASLDLTDGQALAAFASMTGTQRSPVRFLALDWLTRWGDQPSISVVRFSRLLISAPV